jgi:hypothetical protein
MTEKPTTKAVSFKSDRLLNEPPSNDEAKATAPRQAKGVAHRSLPRRHKSLLRSNRNVAVPKTVHFSRMRDEAAGTIAGFKKVMRTLSDSA